MELGDVTGDGPVEEPKLIMHKWGDLLAPKAPVELNAIGSEKNTTVVFPLPLDILTSLGRALDRYADGGQKSEPRQ